MTRITPALCPYPGGKATHARRIINYIPTVDRASGFIETYGGAANILVKLDKRPFEVYNDLSGQMHNLFECLLFRHAELVQMVENTPYSRWALETAVNRAQDPDPVVRAWATFVRLNMARNEHFRQKPAFRQTYEAHKNKNGGRETQVSKRWKAKARALYAVRDRARDWYLENAPAVTVIDRYNRPGNCQYHDPPYLRAVRAKKSGFYAEEMMEPAEHEFFLTAVLHADQAMHLISHYQHDLYDDVLLPAGFKRVQYTARINGIGTKQESLYLCPLVQEALQPLPLFAMVNQHDKRN